MTSRPLQRVFASSKPVLVSASGGDRRKGLTVAHAQSLLRSQASRRLKTSWTRPSVVRSVPSRRSWASPTSRTPLA